MSDVPVQLIVAAFQSVYISITKLKELNYVP